MPDESSIKNIIAAATRWIRMPYQTIIGANWTGGNLKTDDNASGAAGSNESQWLTPPSIRYPEPSAQCVMIPVGNDKVGAGRPSDLHGGFGGTGAYWFLPAPRPETETTMTAARAIRVVCPAPILFTKAQIDVTVGQASSTVTIKVYSSNGVLLWTSNAIDTSGTSFKVSDPATSSPVAGVQLNMGWFYIIEYTRSGTAPTVRAHSMSGTADNFLNNSVAQIGTTAADIVANNPGNAPDFPFIKLF